MKLFGGYPLRGLAIRAVRKAKRLNRLINWSRNAAARELRKALAIAKRTGHFYKNLRSPSSDIKLSVRATCNSVIVKATNEFKLATFDSIINSEHRTWMTMNAGINAVLVADEIANKDVYSSIGLDPKEIADSGFGSPFAQSTPARKRPPLENMNEDEQPPKRKQVPLIDEAE